MTDVSVKNRAYLSYGDLVDLCAQKDVTVTDKDTSETLRAKLAPKKARKE